MKEKKKKKKTFPKVLNDVKGLPLFWRKFLFTV